MGASDLAVLLHVVDDEVVAVPGGLGVREVRGESGSKPACWSSRLTSMSEYSPVGVINV